MRQYWRIKAQSSGGADIFLYEEIGESAFSDGIGAKQFVEQLQALGAVSNIALHVNSPGGSVFEGLAIYNALKTHPAKKTVYVDGVAASMAAFVCLAGDDIKMPGNAMMMFHGARAMAAGTAEDMRKMADTLDRTNESLASILRTRVKSESKIKSLLAEDNWFSARDAKALGLCDEVIEPMAAAAHVDLSKFKNVPPHVRRTIHATYGGNTMEQTDRADVLDILAIGRAHKCEDLAAKAIEKGMTSADFKVQVLETKYKATSVLDTNPDIGMTDAEVGRFSLVRAIRQMGTNGKLDGIEAEASEAAAKKLRKSPTGFFVPSDVMRAQAIKSIKAALGVSPGSAGGYLVGTDVLVSDMIELLRNKTLVAQLGARQLSSLVGNIAIPRQSGAATAYWVPSSGPVNDSSPAFAQLGLVPHRLSADTAYEKELMLQTSLDVEGFVREDLMRILAIEQDRVALFGTGGSQPLGIANTTGIGSVTFGGAASWDSVLDFEEQLANANADIGSICFLTSPGVRRKWKKIPKIANSQYAEFLWQKGATPGSGEVNSYRAEVTNQVPGTGTLAHRVLYGNWSDLLLAQWAGIDVVADPFSLKKQALIEVTVHIWVDNGVRHAPSFVMSSDSGAQ